MTNKTTKLIEEIADIIITMPEPAKNNGFRVNSLLLQVAQSARDEERERIAADFKFHSAFNPSCSCAFIVESLTRND